MYSYTTRAAPQVVYAKRPVKTQSVAQQFNYQAPISKRTQNAKDSSTSRFVPS